MSCSPTDIRRFKKMRWNVTVLTSIRQMKNWQMWLACCAAGITVCGMGATQIVGQENRKQDETPSEQDTQVRSEPEATSLFGKPLFRMELAPEQRERLEKNLAEAQRDYERDPSDPDHLIWLGRRLAYLWRYADAIDVFTKGIELHPDDPRMRRHRGHRYITLRQFDKAIADFEKAAELIAGDEDEVEPDGAPNAAGIPTSTLHTNIWYHLGLSYYLTGQNEKALEAYQKCLKAAKNNDMRVATLDWMYMTLRRLDRDDEAERLIADITPDLEIIENHSYHRRILMYRGLLDPDELLNVEEGEASDLDLATQGYGVANWYREEGELRKAGSILTKVIEGRHWSAFGYIAAEADLVRWIKERIDNEDSPR